MGGTWKDCDHCGERIKAEGAYCLACQPWADTGDWPPFGAAACPFCGAVRLDAQDAGECCPDRRGEPE